MFSYTNIFYKEKSMGSEAETEANSAPPQLQLSSFPLLLRSPEHPGITFTPLHTSASVPFKWEQEPGKPLPCLTLALTSPNDNAIKSLELPPRLLNEGKLTKTPSPTTVLEGPYTLGRSILGSSSFRFLRKKQVSFDGTLSLGGSRGSSPERGKLSTVVLSNKKDKGLFGSWRKRSEVNLKCKSEAHGGSFVFPSLSDDGMNSGCDGGENAQVARVCRRRSLSPSKSHFWATIYGAFKEVIPRRSTKLKNDALQSNTTISPHYQV